MERLESLLKDAFPEAREVSVVDRTGTVIQRSTVDFGDRPLPASIRSLRT